jgi:hypothetical protein
VTVATTARRRLDERWHHQAVAAGLLELVGERRRRALGTPEDAPRVQTPSVLDRTPS